MGKVRDLIYLSSLEFVVIQETKFLDVSDSFIQSLWENMFYEWSFKPSHVNSGGLLSIQCRSKSKTLLSFAYQSFLGIFLEWEANKWFDLW